MPSANVDLTEYEGRIHSNPAQKLTVEETFTRGLRPPRNERMH
jgi:hypothetical protein